MRYTYQDVLDVLTIHWEVALQIKNDMTAAKRDSDAELRIGLVYAALDRFQKQGFVESRLVPPSPERAKSGRSKHVREYRLTNEGIDEKNAPRLEQSQLAPQLASTAIPQRQLIS
jgi:DNA-binding PadR family transcriptional regulator